MKLLVILKTLLFKYKFAKMKSKLLIMKKNLKVLGGECKHE